MADNRSPSPLSASRPINPKLRYSNNNSAVRRSFTSKPSSVLTNSRRFDPTTPANSPSEYPRRHSVDLYPKEKENYEKDQPWLKPSKFQKNFMAPTISAASKFSPSPKKKVLVERNDPVRTSISLSDGKALFFSSNDPKPEPNYHKIEPSNDSNLEKQQQQHLKRVTFSQVLPTHSLITESLTESVISESNSSKPETCGDNEVSCPLDSSPIAPLDADPSLPPYDPKTNYLSPRPQFLHYKPNPRVEILLNKEKGLEADELKQLEDSLMAEILSESFTDSGGSEDSENEEPQEEALISADVVIGVDEEIEDISTSESAESLPNEVAFDEATSEENLAKEAEKKRPQSILRKLVWLSMIVTFVIGFGSVIVFHSPAIEEISLKEVRLSDVSASAKLKFDRFVWRVNEFSLKSAAFFSDLSSELGRGEKIGSLRFVNLSNVQSIGGWNLEESKVDEFDMKEVDLEAEEDHALEDFDAKGDGGIDDVDFDDKGDVEPETDYMVEEEDEVYFEAGSDDSVEEYGSGDDALDSENVRADDYAKTAAEIETELENSESIESQTVVDDPEVDQSLGTSHDQASEVSSPSIMDADSVESAPVTESTHSEHYTIGVLSTVMASFFALVAYTYHHKRNLRVIDVNQPSNNRTSYSQNWQETKMDDGVLNDELCPSELSSSTFKNSSASSYSKKEKTRKTAYSKRESMSDSPSLSYGSFTTFEKIPIKNNGNGGEDEVITPVRRSSRIRSHHQFTSP